MLFVYYKNCNIQITWFTRRVLSYFLQTGACGPSGFFWGGIAISLGLFNASPRSGMCEF